MTAETRFSFDGGALCLDFCNTWESRSDPSCDLLRAYPELASWAAAGGLITRDGERDLLRRAAGRPAEASSAFEQAIALRESIFRTFSHLAAGADAAEEDIAVLNRALAAATPQLELKPGDRCCSWRWAGPDDALDCMLWPVVRSAAELLTSETVDRVRECASPTCSWLFIDTSRNRRRRWCDMSTCGNRAKARRYYRRHRTDSSPA